MFCALLHPIWDPKVTNMCPKRPLGLPRKAPEPPQGSPKGSPGAPRHPPRYPKSDFRPIRSPKCSKQMQKRTPNDPQMDSNTSMRPLKGPSNARNSAAFRFAGGSAAEASALRSAAPWPCARRVRRAKCTLEVLYVFIFFPQVQYVTLVMDLGAPAVPPTRLVHTSFTHRSAHLFCFFDISFSTSFSSSFLSHFGVTFEAPNRPKCPQATIQNRPS